MAGGGIVGQIDCELLEFGCGGGDEFGKIDGAEQAGGYSASKGFADAGEDRQASPEGVACGGMRVIRRGVEEEIREGVAGEVLGERLRAGKDEAVGRDVARRGFIAKVSDGGGIVFK